jgi:hypothetical protein
MTTCPPAVENSQGPYIRGLICRDCPILESLLKASDYQDEIKLLIALLEGSLNRTQN